MQIIEYILAQIIWLTLIGKIEIRNIEKNLFFVFLRFPENMPNGLKWGVHWLQSGFSDKY